MPKLHLGKHAPDWAAPKPPADVRDSLSFHLHQHLAGAQPGRSMHIIHASDVTKDGWCGREIALRLLLGKNPEPEWAGTVTRMVWMQGRLLAERVARLIAQDIPGIEVVADWRCAQCGIVHEFQSKPECCKCLGRLFFYQEVRVTSLVSGIGCGLDMLIKLPGRELYTMFEMKTIDKEKFKKLEAPLAEARDRTRLYLRCIAESEHPNRLQIDTEEARVLYISKGGYGKKRPHPPGWDFKDQGYTPFAEYKVRRKDDVTQGYVDVAAPLWAWMNHTGGLPVGICEGPLCKRAQNCAVRSQCFKGDYPPGSNVGGYSAEGS